MKRPKVKVFAGPNGSGKSTLTEEMPIYGAYINADDIKRHRGCSDLEAAQEAEALREHFLANRMDFTFETVLSTERNILFLQRAKDTGYFIESVFVLTNSSEVNVLRVQSRVAEGGHDVPIEKIRKRYGKSLCLLKTLAQMSDECEVYDNTEIPCVIYRKDADGEEIMPSEYWSKEQILKLLY
jgi:predicted ABC-type ATPase